MHVGLLQGSPGQAVHRNYPDKLHHSCVGLRAVKEFCEFMPSPPAPLPPCKVVFKFRWGPMFQVLGSFIREGAYTSACPDSFHHPGVQGWKFHYLAHADISDEQEVNGS